MQMTRIVIGTLWLVMFWIVGCRVSKFGKDYPDNGQNSEDAGAQSGGKAPIIQPQKQTEFGAVLNLTLDESGKVKETVTLRLDYFPAPRADGVSVPTCYSEFAHGFVLGRLICGSNGNVMAEVNAGQVDQQCFSSSTVRKIAAKSPLVLVGCTGAARLYTNRFDPELKLEVVQ